MKKLFSLCLMVGLCLVVLIGCGKVETLDMELTEVLDKVYAGVEEDMPKVMNMEITDENIAYYLGVESLDYKEGIASEAMNSSIPHSVVVVRVNDGVDIEQIKQEIKEKANPRKWICVEAESVIVESKGDVIILIMTNTDLAEKVQTNFNNL